MVEHARCICTMAVWSAGSWFDVGGGGRSGAQVLHGLLEHQALNCTRQLHKVLTCLLAQAGAACACSTTPQGRSSASRTPPTAQGHAVRLPTPCAGLSLAEAAGSLSGCLDRSSVPRVTAAVLISSSSEALLAIRPPQCWSDALLQARPAPPAAPPTQREAPPVNMSVVPPYPPPFPLQLGCQAADLGVGRVQTRWATRAATWWPCPWTAGPSPCCWPRAL